MTRRDIVIGYHLRLYIELAVPPICDGVLQHKRHNCENS